MTKTEELKKYIEDHQIVGLNVFFTDSFYKSELPIEEKRELICGEIISMLKSATVEDKDLF